MLTASLATPINPRAYMLLLSMTIALTTAACASHGSTRTTHRAPDQTPTPLVRSSLSPLNAIDIAQLPPALNALDVVRRLRPQYLQARGGASLGAPVAPSVYVDELRIGGVDALTSVPARSIAEIRYFTPFDASNTFASAYGGGVIWITTRRGR